MYPEPEYAQNIVVGVIFLHTFAWYITDKEHWYLDYFKYDRALLASGYKNTPLGDYSNRFDIAVLNEDTAEHFRVRQRLADQQDNLAAVYAGNHKRTTYRPTKEGGSNSLETVTNCRQ